MKINSGTIIECIDNTVFKRNTRLISGIMYNLSPEVCVHSISTQRSNMRNILLKGLVAASFAAATVHAGAQTVSSTAGQATVKKPKPINSEFSGGIRLNSDGWSVFAEKGYVVSEETKLRDQFHNVRLFQVELSEHKDPKEVKRSVTDQTASGGTQKSKPFVFGKINNFYALKLGYGMRRMIAGKPEPGTVSVHWVYAGGLSLGMEKPYYLDGYVPQDNPGTLVPATFKYSDSTKLSFLTEQYIRGGAGFAKGLNEIEFIPGIHAKTALHFDFAASRKSVMAVETGVSAEYYTRGINIMANQKARPLFVNLFASIQFGRRR